MSGAAGTAMLWYWDGYVHPSNLYHVLTPVTQVRRRRRLAACPAEADRGHPRGAGRRPARDVPRPDRPAAREWGKPASSAYTVHRDGTVKGGPVAMTLGSPARGNPDELFTRLTWHLDLPAAGHAVARLGQVCSGARLQVSLDGKVSLDRKLTAGEARERPLEVGQATGAVERLGERLRRGPGHRRPRRPPRADLREHRGRLAPDPLAHAARLPIEPISPGWTPWDSPASASSCSGFTTRRAPGGVSTTQKRPGMLKSVRARVPAADGSWRVEWWDTRRGVVLRTDKLTASGGELLLAHSPSSRPTWQRAQAPNRGCRRRRTRPGQTAMEGERRRRVRQRRQAGTRQK